MKDDVIRVMLLDDHPVVRAGLRAILDSLPNITVVAEGSNGAAVEQLIDPGAGDEVPEVDVVVTDIQMPEVDGISATARLQEAGGPPVLVLSTYDTQANIVAAMQAGALGYVLKDSPEEELYAAIVATAAGERTFSPHVAAALAERVQRPDEALTAREIDILRALATGATNKELAAALFISVATVKTHLVHIYQKLGVDTRTAAVTEARARKLLGDD